MEGYQTEEQQLAVVRNFWRQKKSFIVAFLTILALTFIGGYSYRQYDAKNTEQAANVYQDLLASVQNVDVSKAKEQGSLLLKNYSKTTYAPLGAMILARLAFDEKDFPDAIEKLRYVVANGKKSPLWHVAQIKLARLLSMQGDHQAALKELDNPANGYVPLYEELKGDIYVTLNDLVQARQAYKNAIASSEGNPVPWLEMKLTNINTVEDAVTKGAVDAVDNKQNS